MPQILRRLERVRAGQKLRTAHGYQLFSEQALGDQARVAATSDSHTRVDPVALEVGQLQRRRDADVDLRVRFVEARKPGNQPLRGEDRGDAQHERAAEIVLAKGLHGSQELREARPQPREAPGLRPAGTDCCRRA